MTAKRILKRDTPNYGLALPELFDAVDTALDELAEYLSPMDTMLDARLGLVRNRWNRIRQETAGLIARTPPARLVKAKPSNG